MIVALFLLVYATILQISFTSSSYCSSGQWIDNYKDNKHDIQEYKFLSFFKDNYTTSKELLMESCPVELFIQNCRYHGISDRSNILLNRKWIPENSSNCIPYKSSNFLSLLRNKKLYMLGDSVMHQVWTTLFCSLYNKQRIIYDIRWLYYDHKNICLFRNGYHCSYHTSLNVSYFHDIITNTTVYFGWLSPILTPKSSYIKTIIDIGNLNHNDIILINIGAHYNYGQQFLYKNHLDLIRSEVNKLDITSNHIIPTIFFMETFPQHFDSIYNGYFSDKLNSRQCKSINNTRLININWDWRNILAKSHFNNTVITLLSISNVLYSQYDAHIARDSLLTKTNDCTHYCYESDVFRYVHTVIYNEILNMNHTI